MHGPISWVGLTRAIHRAGFALALLAPEPGGARAAELVLNEILYDPPGADHGREFVEILNVSDAALPLAGLELEVGDGARPNSWRVAWRGGSGSIAPGEFLLVGGDSVPNATFHLDLDLQNGPDAVRLRRAAQVLDRVGYGALSDPEYFESHPAEDVSGKSLARLPDGHDSDDNAADFGAADPTPGWRNQPLRALHLDVTLPDVTRLWPGRRLAASTVLRNAGLEPLPASGWSFEAWLRGVQGEPYVDSLAIAGAWPLEVRGVAGDLAPGDSVRFDLAWSGTAGLFALDLQARATGDDSILGMQRCFLRVGAGAVVVNEIQYAPEPGAPEWVELWNRDGRAHDLSEWTLEDAGGKPARLHPRCLLPAGGFAVVSADTAQPIAGTEPGVRRLAATPWPSLNNSDGPEGYADQLVLRDRVGVVHDALRYAAAWGAERGRSLERLLPEPDVRGILWATCKAQSRSTPGRRNSSSAPPQPQLGVALSPNPFSPDGDGRDEVLGIALQIPEGCDGFRASLFDLAGRRRLNLGGDRLGPGPRHLAWDGKDASGSPLPEGVYLLHLELYSKSGTRLQDRRAIGLVRR